MIADDTIAAIATGAGPAGVGIVRLSGARAVAIAAAVLGVEEGKLDRRVRVGWARDGEGRGIDQVLAFAMRAPASFTGEDVAELHGHGGAQNLGRLLAEVVARGARVAEPGEFTRRAVANGKLDVVRAEALLEVIHAGSERAWRLAQATLEGRLGAAVEATERRAHAVLAELEGWIDFPEADLDPQSGAWIAAELGAVEATCARFADGFRHGRAVSGGVVVALVGEVNVGKSSLLNALVGRERALVAAEPGTTRDWLEVAAVWDGVAVTLVDTAGTRETADVVELRGIALGQARVAAADVVVVVDDGRGDTRDYGARELRVRSKADLGGGPLGDGVIATSAVTGQGLDELKRAVLARAGVAEREGSEDAVVTTARQHAAVSDARAAFAAAHLVWAEKRPLELAAIELRRGVEALARLRGVEVGERVLDEIFARFCIGK